MLFNDENNWSPKNGAFIGSLENKNRYMAGEDKEEGMDRMENEGSGVVPTNFEDEDLVMRNDLVLQPSDKADDF